VTVTAVLSEIRSLQAVQLQTKMSTKKRVGAPPAEPLLDAALLREMNRCVGSAAQREQHFVCQIWPHGHRNRHSTHLI
jgi:hypothetical protein